MQFFQTAPLLTIKQLTMTTIKLSPQREIFVEEIVKGKTQADAYRIAFPSSIKWPEKTLYSKASDLMTDGKVKERLKEIREPIEKKLGEHLLYTAENSFKNYKLAQQIALNKKKYISVGGELKEINDEDIPSFLKAEELTTKLLGINAPDKQDVELNINKIPKIIDDLK